MGQAFPKPEPSLYLLDMANPFGELRKIHLEDGYLESHPDFTPHGISMWMQRNGTVLIYVISHWPTGDSVEVFKYNPKKVSLTYLRSLRHPILYELNGIVAVDEDTFYATTLFYSRFSIFKMVEMFLRLPLMHVAYFNGKTGETKYAATHLSMPNGITESNNKRYRLQHISCIYCTISFDFAFRTIVSFHHRFVYVSHTGRSQLMAFTRNPDHTLKLAQVS